MSCISQVQNFGNQKVVAANSSYSQGHDLLTDDKISQLSFELMSIKTTHGGFISADKRMQLLEQGVSKKELDAIEAMRGKLLGGMLPNGRYNKNDPSGSNPPPAQQGVYRITNSSGDVKYVGETNNLARRETEHEASGKLKGTENFEYKTLHGNTSTTTRREIETDLIHKYEPDRNQKCTDGQCQGRKK